jgi:NADPH:quinone reductase-like Zn-dependent oxidoreductase
VKHTRIIVTHYGGLDALQVLEEECPEPKDGEVRVKMLAAGVSLPDIMTVAQCDICRPDLLFELELDAALPVSDSTIQSMK